MMILQLPDYQAGFPPTNRDTTFVDPKTKYITLVGGAYGTTSEAVASEEAGHNTSQQATVFSCQVSFEICVCVRASVCVLCGGLEHLKIETIITVSSVCVIIYNEKTRPKYNTYI
jgi:hypothetical protein